MHEINNVPTASCVAPVDAEALAVYEALADQLITATNMTYTMVGDGDFTVHADQNVYYVVGTTVEPIVDCPTDGMIYENYYCSEYMSNTSVS